MVLRGLVVLGVVAGIDAVLVEPGWIEVTRLEVRSAVLRGPMRIAHLSDLHLHGIGGRERKLIELVARERPDAIVITGDTVDDGESGQARELIASLHAPLGIWMVRGNWENWRPISDEARVWEAAGAHLLVDQGRALRDDVWLVGLDDPLSGNPDLDGALRGAPAASFHLAAFHSPSLFPRIASRIDLALAGHTHGGQVRLPFVGALWLPPGSGEFVAGRYTSGAATLYVSRGIGTSVAPVRFFCRPELAIIDLLPAR
jgi:predicted MPP superfamily phosphohydrolase